MKKFIISTILILFLLISGNHVYATTSNCSLSPTEFWLDGNKSIWLSENRLNLSCQVSLGINDVWANITYPSGTPTEKVILENITPTEHRVYIFLNNMLPSGQYIVTTYFGNETNNFTNSFHVHKLTSTILPLSKAEIYADELLNLKFDFKLNGQEITSTTKTNFGIYLGDSPLYGSRQPTLNYWDITTNVQNIVPGDYDVAVYATYTDNFNNEYTVSTKCYSCLKIKPSLTTDIVDPPIFSPYELLDTQDLEVTVKVMYKSQILNDGYTPIFKAEIDDHELFIKKVTYSNGVWKLSVNVPKLNPKETPYNLDIITTYNGISAKSPKSLPIRSILRFEGVLKNAEGTLIENVEIRLTGIVSEKVNTNTSGFYSVNIIPGIYDIELFSSKIQAKIFNVNLSSSVTNPIKYDYFEKDKFINDINAVMVVVLDTSLSFDKTHLQIMYDDSKVDENQIIIYKCNNWDFNERLCSGAWKKVDATIDTITNIISFDVSELSAFAVSEGNYLKIIANLNKDNYFLGETAILNGRVLDNKNNTVSDVKITYKLLNSDITGTIITDSQGNFDVEFATPKQEGAFTVEIKAEKPFYSSDKLNINTQVQKKKELSISTIPVLNMNPSLSKTTLFFIRNTGQAILDNIYIYITGLPTEWYNLNNSKINQLNPDEKEEFELTFSIPKDADIQEYIVGIEVRSYTFSEKTSFVLKVSEAEPVVKEKPSSEESTMLSSTKNKITGLLGSMKITVNDQYLLILLVVVILMIIKKKKLKKPFSRFSIMKELNEIKSETLKIASISKPRSIKKSKGKLIQKTKKNMRRVINNPFSS